jgi:hypothetical protein
MPSNNARIYAALKGFLDAYPDVPFVAYGGTSFDPPDDGSEYLIVDDVRFENLRKYQGSTAPDWETGNFAIHTMTPLWWSDLQHAEYIGRIQDYFAKDTPISYDGLTVKVGKKPSINNAGFRDGGMWRQTLMIPWEGMV